MAEAEIVRVCGDAEQRWPLKAVTVVHRYGRIVPGERIVLVAVSAAPIAGRRSQRPKC